MRIFVGLLLLAVGVLLIVKTESLIRTFGTNAWAEAKMGGSGGTRTLYKLIGLGLIFFSFLLITNLMGGFLEATLGRIFIQQ